MTLDLTIAIPAKNEGKNLPKCLEAIGTDLARKVVIIDSGSTDDTVSIGLQYGAEVINFAWDGKFPKKRNWYLRHHTPQTRWVFFLDADEYLTPEFKKELRATLERNEDKEGYWLNYTVYFMGKQLKGGYPLKKLSLFRVGKAEYERIDEDKWSAFDMEIHEHPILTGETGVIKSKIDHRDYRGIAHYRQKHMEYASWESYRYIKDVHDPQKTRLWTWKQRLKYRLIKSVFVGPVYFWGSFVFMGGFRDGATGLAFAIFKMSYFNEIHCRIKEQEVA